MMAYLARKPLPPVSPHSNHQQFTSALQKKLDSSLASDGGVKPLVQKFGADSVQHALAFDVQPSLSSLEKQLAVERNFDLQNTDYGQKLQSAQLSGAWTVSNTYKQEGSNTILESRLTGEKGETGVVEFAFDGKKLTLNEEYKGNLPSTVTGTLNGETISFPTMSYLSVNAIRGLGATAENVTQFKISRLQHQITVAHTDWLQRTGKTDNLSDAISHTSWFKRINGMARMAGLELESKPEIVLQESPAWRAAHPDAALRDWNYVSDEPVNISVEAITNRPLPEVDDADVDWRPLAKEALDNHLDQLPTEKAEQLGKRLDQLALTSAHLEARYDLPESGPKDLNYDVVFNTKTPSRQTGEAIGQGA